MTLNKMSESKKCAMVDGWRVDGISVSWATTDEDIEEQDRGQRLGETKNNCLW